MPRIEGTKAGTDPVTGHEIWRPVVLVTIQMPNGLKGQGPAIIDSGADSSVLPFEAVLGAGIAWDDLDKGGLSMGAGGTFERRLLGASIYYRTWKVCDRVEVAEPGRLGTILLGRNDFFKAFVVRFAWHKSPPEVYVDPIVVTPKKRR